MTSALFGNLIADAEFESGWFEKVFPLAVF